jgi:hypothetical protein
MASNPASTTAMPLRGERAAPTFDKLAPRSLARYVDDLERLFIHAKIATEADKKMQAVYYIDYETEQTWRTFPEYANPAKSYKDLKDAILIHYPDATGDYVYSIRDMDMLIGERQRIGINTKSDLSTFHLQFLTITTWLIQKNQLGDLEAKRAYLRAFPAALLLAINTRLQILFTNQHPNVPHEIANVYEAARFVLQSLPQTQDYYVPAPPVNTSQRPVTLPITSVAAPEHVVKTENISAMLAEIQKAIVDLQSRSPRSSEPQRVRQTDCNFCAGPHYIRDCGLVAEYAAAGKCKRNMEGKVVLPSGAFVPREIPGTLLCERIDEYHRRFQTN